MLTMSAMQCDVRFAFLYVDVWCERETHVGPANGEQRGKINKLITQQGILV